MFFPIFFAESDTTQLAPFFRASLTNLFPLFFLPLSAKNKLPFFIDLVSVDNPSKLINFL